MAALPRNRAMTSFELKLSLRALLYGQWVALKLGRIDRGYAAELFGLRVKLLFDSPQNDRVDYSLRNTLADSLRALAQRASDKALELDCRVAAEAPDLLVGDPGRLRQR